jgi:hypothetical protein
VHPGPCSVAQEPSIFTARPHAMASCMSWRPPASYVPQGPYLHLLSPLFWQSVQFLERQCDRAKVHPHVLDAEAVANAHLSRRAPSLIPGACCGLGQIGSLIVGCLEPLQNSSPAALQHCRGLGLPSTRLPSITRNKMLAPDHELGKFMVALSFASSFHYCLRLPQTPVV